MLEIDLLSLRMLPAPPRGVLAAFVLALLTSDVALAAPPPQDLREQAEALEVDGRHADAAGLWERLAKEATDDRQRLSGYLHAIDAWEAAVATSDDPAHHDAATSMILRAVEDPQIDDRARQELRAALERFEPAEVAPRVELLDPDGAAPRGGPRVPAPTVDNPRPSPLTIGGGVTLALAAPAVGGLVYAVLADRAIARDAEAQRDALKAGGDVDKIYIDQRRPEAILLRDLQIGLGVTAAVLVTTGVALVVAGQRARRPSSVSILPQAGRGLGGLALTGRF